MSDKISNQHVAFKNFFIVSLFEYQIHAEVKFHLCVEHREKTRPEVSFILSITCN